jgi:structure-specific endonuclease subunit SLX1
MPRRPLHSLKSIMSNIHLLTRVSSFARWPLNLHFLAKEAYTAWQSRIQTTQQPGRAGLQILTDFGHGSSINDPSSPSGGIYSLPLDYSPLTEYVVRAHNVVSFEQEGNCVFCEAELESGKGLHGMCPNDNCKAMGHLTCWSGHALPGQHAAHIIPQDCSCPSCGGHVRWGDMMKELSLRVRGSKDVQKLVKGAEKASKAASS